MDYSKIKLDFDIQGCQPQDLFLSENFESAKYTAYNLIENFDWDGALLFASALEDKLSAIMPADQNQKLVYSALEFWVLRLKLFDYSGLRSALRSELFKNSLIKMLRYGLDVKKAVYKYLDFFDSMDIIKAETNDLVFLLQNSKEYLGNLKNFPNIAFRPTVSFWLKEYQVVISTSGTSSQPGTFHIIKFFDSNQYVKYLVADDRRVLNELLDFYNFVINPITEIDIKKVGALGEDLENMETQSTPYFNSQHLILPFSVTQTEPKMVKKILPQAPTPKGQPQAKKVSMDEIGEGGSKVLRSQNPSFAKASEGRQEASGDKGQGGKQELGSRNYELGVGAGSRQAADSGKKASASVQNQESKKEQLVIREKPASAVAPTSGVDLKSILPNYNKPFTVPLINSDTLATKIKQKQELGNGDKEQGQGAGIQKQVESIRNEAVGVASQKTLNNQGPAPVKAAETKQEDSARSGILKFPVPGGQGTSEQNSSNRILNRKPETPNAQLPVKLSAAVPETNSKQTQIEQKLKELAQRIKGEGK